jgi:hypothetical protein
VKLSVRHPGVPRMQANSPLYERVPSRDEEGRPLSDFMILIPGLRDADIDRFNDRVAGIQAVLGRYSEVVFADLNVPINLLWVSLVPRFGLIGTIAGEIQQRIPEALLVASDRS